MFRQSKKVLLLPQKRSKMGSLSAMLLSKGWMRACLIANAVRQKDARRYEDKEWAMGLGRMTGNLNWNL
jgi:hypothetical protein